MVDKELLNVELYAWRKQREYALMMKTNVKMCNENIERLEAALMSHGQAVDPETVFDNVPHWMKRADE